MRSLIIVGLLCVAGCASVPLSTMSRLGDYDRETIADLDPGGVLVRVSLPVAYGLDVDATRLSFRLESAEETYGGEFDLARLSEEEATIAGGFFSADIPVRRYLLGLSEEGQTAFSELRGPLRSAPLESFDFSVSTRFDEWPEDTESIRLWIDLQLTEAEGFFTLVDGGKLKIEQQAAD